MIHTVVYDTPFGSMILGEHEGQLCLCDWYVSDREWVRKRVAHYLHDSYQEHLTTLHEETIKQLEKYFSCHLMQFNIPLKLCGTQFQQKVWAQLLSVPYGSTLSYKALAESLARPNACRAVASAARANAISIIVPCHRIIGVDNSITGYAGGIEAKKLLLEIESNGY